MVTLWSPDGRMHDKKNCVPLIYVELVTLKSPGGREYEKEWCAKLQPKFAPKYTGGAMAPRIEAL